MQELFALKMLSEMGPIGTWGEVLGACVAGAAIIYTTAAAVYGVSKLIEKIKIKRNLKKISKLVNADEMDKKGKTALMKATSIEECEALLAKGANLNFQNHDGNTALMLVEKNPCKEEIVKWLCEHGADTNLVNKDGKSALMFQASRYNADTVVRTLLDYDADASLVSKDGKTAAYYYEPVRKWNPKLYQYLKDAEKSNDAPSQDKEVLKRTLSVQERATHIKEAVPTIDKESGERFDKASVKKKATKEVSEKTDAKVAKVDKER